MVGKNEIRVQVSDQRVDGVNREWNLRHYQRINGEPQPLSRVHQVWHPCDLAKVDGITQRDKSQPCVANPFFEVRIHEKSDLVPSLA